METSMSSETRLFLRKTEELSRLVSAMKRLEVHREISELHEIEKRLTDLSIAVNKDRCLNAGGKFEWVDSVLVKVSSIIPFLLFFFFFWFEREETAFFVVVLSKSGFNSRRDFYSICLTTVFRNGLFVENISLFRCFFRNFYTMFYNNVYRKNKSILLLFSKFLYHFL